MTMNLTRWSMGRRRWTKTKRDIAELRVAEAANCNCTSNCAKMASRVAGKRLVAMYIGSFPDGTLVIISRSELLTLLAATAAAWREPAAPFPFPLPPPRLLSGQLASSSYDCSAKIKHKKI